MLLLNLYAAGGVMPVTLRASSCSQREGWSKEVVHLMLDMQVLLEYETFSY